MPHGHQQSLPHTKHKWKHKGFNVSYIGNSPISAAFLTDTFSGTGSQTAFTMTVAPANTSSILVSITGVLQSPDTYSVSGTTLTFSAAPPSGTSNISVRYLGIPASGVTTTAYRTVTNFTATAAQTSFSVPSYTVGYIDVYRNGVRLVSTDYTATTGTTVVLVNACTSGDSVVTESFLVSSVLNAIPATAGAINLTSATYLSGVLPVVNGGTGLTAVTYTIQVFTSSGTYTKPSGVAFAKVTVVGGGGGAAASTYQNGSGGGGGGTSMKLIAAASIGATETITIGAGGAANAGATGGAGGTSSFGSHCSATGGSGGGGASTFPAAGSGGAGSGGTVNFTGSGGQTGWGSSSNPTQAGRGGSSSMGGGAIALAANGTVGNGNTGGNYGGGGSGATNGNSGGPYSGGAGAVGIIIVEEYY